MEKAISTEEKIRRAEEIYQRRRANNANGIRVSSSSVNSSKPKLSLFKKMALQLAICSVIYIIFYLIKNTNYIFSEDVISKTKEMLSYDINFEKVYSEVSTFVEQNKDYFVGTEIDENNVEENLQSENVESGNEQAGQEGKEDGGTDSNNIEDTDENNELQEGGIGGAESNEIEETSADEDTKKTQMEIDAEYVKSNYSFKVPLKGTITSRYGEREATEIVSANHQGIDIGADIGTAIYAAMEGKVSLVSSEGDYRKTCGNNKRRCFNKICTL